MKEPEIIDIGNPLNLAVEPSRATFFTPLTSRGFPRWLVLLMGVVGVIYILNPTMGIIEFIPDNLPIVGNLDEGAAFMFIIYAIQELVVNKKAA